MGEKRSTKAKTIFKGQQGENVFYQRSEFTKKW